MEKFKVLISNKKTSKQVQEILLGKGCKWIVGSQVITIPTSLDFYIMVVGISLNWVKKKSLWWHDDSKEISIEDLKLLNYNKGILQWQNP